MKHPRAALFSVHPILLLLALGALAGQRAVLRAQDAVTLSGVEVRASELPASDTLRQEAPVGPYQQPEWTTQRGFGTSRVFVRPPGSVEFVQYWTPDISDGTAEHSFREEIEIGLPHRFQLDFYQNWRVDEEDRPTYRGSSLELRYALADWGKIPLNPTLYGEWNFNCGAPDVWEAKLLLGETIAPRWAWAANLVFEQEIGGARTREISLSSALSYAAIDQVLNVGVEMLAERKTEHGSRSQPKYELLVGPSLNVRPTRQSFITIAPLFGLTEDAPEVEIFFLAGLHFQFGGPRSEKEEGPRAPASMSGR